MRVCAGICVYVRQDRGRYAEWENRNTCTQKHVRGVSETLSYSHPKSLWCLLCYSTLCCDSSTDLINLYWHCSHHFCELYPTVKCVRLQCRPVTLTNWNYFLIHALVNSPGLQRGGKDTQGTAAPHWISSVKTSKGHTFFLWDYLGQKVQVRASDASLTKDDRHRSGSPFLLTRGQQSPSPSTRQYTSCVTVYTSRCTAVP